MYDMAALKTMMPERNARHSGQDKAYVTSEDMKQAVCCLEYWEDAEHLAQNQEEYKKFKSQVQPPESATLTTLKRQGHSANGPEVEPNKRQKSGEGKQETPCGAAGDKSRVPSQGQKVQWHRVGGGYMDGEVVEVVYEEKKVDGKTIKASKEDPRVVVVVVKSERLGKTVVHKPEAVYWN